MNDQEFEYPIIFLELIDYLSGSRIHYPQELFANKLEKIENETNAPEQSDLDSDDLSPDYHYQVKLLPYRGLDSDRIYYNIHQNQNALKFEKPSKDVDEDVQKLLSM